MGGGVLFWTFWAAYACVCLTQASGFRVVIIDLLVVKHDRACQHYRHNHHHRHHLHGPNHANANCIENPTDGGTEP